MAKPVVEKLRKFIRRYRKELVLAILVSIAFSASLYIRLEQKKIEKLWQHRSEKETQLEMLRALVTQYPDSRDLLYRQATLELELGNDEEASRAIDRARYLDPNNPVLPTLEVLRNQSATPFLKSCLGKCGRRNLFN